METPLTYAIIGTGAIGGYYGALFHRSGKEVHFLLHSDYEHVRRQGLRVFSVKGDFLLPQVNAYGRAEDLPRCDVAIVALKATANAALPGILPSVLNEKGIVLLLQNGFGQEGLIAPIPGVKTILSGLCFICSAKTAPGTIRHQDYGSLNLSQYTPDQTPGGITPIMRQIAADFALAGIPVDLNPDLIDARWRKLVWNVPFSGLTTLFGIDTAEVLNAEPLQILARDLMLEVVAGAAAFERNIPESFVDKMMSDTLQMRPYFPSMKLDFDAGKAMELDAMYKEPLAAVALRGKRLTRMEMLYEELSFLQDKNITYLSDWEV